MGNTLGGATCILTCTSHTGSEFYCVGGDVKHCTIQSNPQLRKNQLTITRQTPAVCLVNGGTNVQSSTDNANLPTACNN